MGTVILTPEVLEQEKQRRLNQRATQKKRMKLVWVNPDPKSQKAAESGKNE